MLKSCYRPNFHAISLYHPHRYLIEFQDENKVKLANNFQRVRMKSFSPKKAQGDVVGDIGAGIGPKEGWNTKISKPIYNEVL